MSAKEHTITAPVLAINSEAFTYWSKNFKLVESLIEEASPSPAWLLTVRGTIHVNQSDFSILFPNVCSLVLKMTADPQRALDININASLEFLKMVMPGIPERIAAVFPREGILSKEEAPLEEIPEIMQHRPQNEKWTGGRLSIPHEFWWRITPSLARKAARKKVTAGGGLPGEEVWVHKRPSDEVMEKYSTNDRGESQGRGNTCSNAKPQSVPHNKGQANKQKHNAA